MDSLRNLFAKPDPQAQLRKCNTVIRQNMRKLDRDIAQVKRVETQSKNLILQADRRAQRDPTRAKQAQKEVRDFAREMVRARKAGARLVTSKAQLSSVQMQVAEAFAVRRIEGSIRAGVGIMRDVNSLIRLPELAGTMRDLSLELVRAGIVEEMVGEVLPEDDVLEDEAAEGEVDRVLGEILRDRMEKTGKLPAVPVEKEPEEPERAEEETEEDTAAALDQMRNRLEALRS